MKLYFFNEKFERISLLLNGQDPSIENSFGFSNFTWTKKFSEADEFGIVIPLSVDNTSPYYVDLTYLKDECRYVVRADTGHVGYIEEKKMNSTDGTLEMSGFGVTKLLEKRITAARTYSNYGTVGEVMCAVINQNLPYSWLIANPENNIGGPDIVLNTDVNGNVYKYIKNLSEAYKIAFTSRYDEGLNKVLFKIIVPDFDKIVDQISNNRDNASSVQYTKSSSNFYNYLRLIGDKDITVISQNVQPGEETYQISIKSNIKIDDMSESEYRIVLQHEADTMLKTFFNESFFEIVPTNSNVIYEIGDVVACGANFIKENELKYCCECTELWETTYSIDYVFGEKKDITNNLTNITIQG